MKLYRGERNYYGIQFGSHFYGFVKIDGKRYWLWGQEH